MFLKNPDLPGDGNPGGLLRCANIVSDVLGAESCAVIAGMALSAFGYVRGTLDAHFISKDDPGQILSSLRKNGIDCLLTWGDPEDPLPWVVRGDIEGVRFDILPQVPGTRVERGNPLPGLGIRVCGVSDFIALKC